MSAFKHTLLPEPVEPATNRCFIFVMSPQIALPSMSLPRPNMSEPGLELLKRSEQMISFNPTMARCLFGTSILIEPFS